MVPIRPAGGGKTPRYYKVYPTLWLSDPGIRLASAAARGVWLHLLVMFYESPRPGELLLADGSPMSVADVAERLRVDPVEMAPLIDDLVTVGLMVVRDGVYVSRQMEGGK